jgi:hypothetical protein
MLPYGQSRVLAAWDELILPNGSRISLRGMSAADGQGQSGMEDQVDNHFWKTWSSALLVSFLGVAAQQSQPQNQGAFNTPSGSAQASAAAMNSLSDVSSKILQKKLEHFTHAASSPRHGVQRHGQPLDHLADLGYRRVIKKCQWMPMIDCFIAMRLSAIRASNFEWNNS